MNDSVDVHPISGLLNKERNVFVRKTLEAASRGSRTKGHYLKSTVLDKNSTLKKIPFYPCENSPADTVSVSIIDSETKQIPVAKRCVPPHMQYKSNKSLYELIEFPLRSFEIKDQWESMLRMIRVVIHRFLHVQYWIWYSCTDTARAVVKSGCS